MDCPRCKNQLKVTATARGRRRVCRILKCKTCDVRFTSEEVLYDISSEKGEELMHTTYRLKNEQQKLNAAMTRVERKPKGRRKVAGSPKPVKEGEVYLTYGELISKWKSAYPGCIATDFRPYPLLDYSIIVWVKDKDGLTLEFAYQYIPEEDKFIPIEGAKIYEQILNDARRKK